MLVGLISDTHGVLDPRVARAFAGVEVILHAGDIGSEEVLRGLERLAPVKAVAGNNDGALLHLALPLTADFVLNGVQVHLVHRLKDAQFTPSTGVIVYGHSHKPLITERDRVLYVNPGAAGRVGFHRELTVALLRLGQVAPRAEIVVLGLRLSKPIATTVQPVRARRPPSGGYPAPK